MDLYKPTFDGLEYFYDRMTSGGVILVHDYFTKDLSGVKKAVEEFCDLHEEACKIPIGDGQSIAIVKS